MLEALARLAAAGRIDPARVELRIAGNVWVPALPSAGAVEVVRLGYVDHARAVEEMASADVLVAHVDPSSRNTPAKVFEYLATGRPVLCVTHPESLSHRLVARARRGLGGRPARRAPASSARSRTPYRRWTAGDLPTRPDVREQALRRHGRDVLARELAAVLERAAGRPDHPSSMSARDRARGDRADRGRLPRARRGRAEHLPLRQPRLPVPPPAPGVGADAGAAAPGLPARGRARARGRRRLGHLPLAARRVRRRVRASAWT